MSFGSFFHVLFFLSAELIYSLKTQFKYCKIVISLTIALPDLGKDKKCKTLRLRTFSTDKKIVIFWAISHLVY
jgi:hypothetical protein